MRSPIGPDSSARSASRVGDEPLLRCYSMSSAPETDDDLVVTVKRVPGGAGSNWLHDAGDRRRRARGHQAGRRLLRRGAGATDRRLLRWQRDHPGHVDRPQRPALVGPEHPAPLRQPRRRGRSSSTTRSMRWWRSTPTASRCDHHLDEAAGYLDAGHDRRASPGRPTPMSSSADRAPFMDLVESTLLGSGVDPDRIAIERFVDAAPPRWRPPRSRSRRRRRVGHPDRARQGHDRGPPHRRHDPGDRPASRHHHRPTRARPATAPPAWRWCARGRPPCAPTTRSTPGEVEEGWVLTCQAQPTSARVTVEFEAF